MGAERFSPEAERKTAAYTDGADKNRLCTLTPGGMGTPPQRGQTLSTRVIRQNCGFNSGFFRFF